jgi:hypothetical protein
VLVAPRDIRRCQQRLVPPAQLAITARDPPVFGSAGAGRKGFPSGALAQGADLCLCPGQYQFSLSILP